MNSEYPVVAKSKVAGFLQPAAQDYDNECGSKYDRPEI